MLAQTGSDIPLTAMLVSGDNLQMTMIIAPTDASTESQNASLGAVRSLVGRFTDDDLSFRVIGQSAWMEEAFASATRDQTMFSIAGLLVGVATALKFHLPPIPCSMHPAFCLAPSASTFLVL